MQTEVLLNMVSINSKFQCHNRSAVGLSEAECHVVNECTMIHTSHWQGECKLLVYLIYFCRQASRSKGFQRNQSALHRHQLNVKIPRQNEPETSPQTDAKMTSGRLGGSCAWKRRWRDKPLGKIACPFQSERTPNQERSANDKFNSVVLEPTVNSLQTIRLEECYVVCFFTS